MRTSPVFSGSAPWFLGEATPVGMHTDTPTFTATPAPTGTCALSPATPKSA